MPLCNQLCDKTTELARKSQIETDRLVAGDAVDNRETALDRAVRPQTLDDYIGQTAVKEQMEIFLSAAKGRGEPLITR